MSWLYLVSLLVALGCMVLLDWRFRLAFWFSVRRATIVVAVGTAFLIAWDAGGIALGIFLRGASRFSTGIVLAPGFPIEEFFFLLFLVYLTLVLVRGVGLVFARVGAAR